jgi:hypothetical protein
MLQSVVQGAPVFASALVQLASLEEPPPPAPEDDVPAAPDPPAPVVVVLDDSLPLAPVVVVDDPEPPAPVVVVVDEDVPLELVSDEVAEDDEPLAPLTPEPLVPLSVLLEHAMGMQKYATIAASPREEIRPFIMIASLGLGPAHAGPDGS